MVGTHAGGVHYFTPGMPDISTPLEPAPVSTSRQQYSFSRPPASSANSNNAANNAAPNNARIRQQPPNGDDDDVRRTPPFTSSSATICTSKVCGDRVDVVDCGDEVADWLGDALCRSEGDAPRLLRINPRFQRISRKKSVAAGFSSGQQDDESPDTGRYPRNLLPVFVSNT